MECLERQAFIDEGPGKQTKGLPRRVHVDKCSRAGSLREAAPAPASAGQSRAGRVSELPPRSSMVKKSAGEELSLNGRLSMNHDTLPRCSRNPTFNFRLLAFLSALIPEFFFFWNPF